MEKVIDLEDRIPSFRERRKRRTNFKFTLLTTIFVIVLLFLLYLQSSYSKVQKIVVEGHHLEQQQFYIDKSQIAVGESMWSFKINDVERQLEDFEWVKSVEVKRKLLNSVTIEIEEYKKVAYLSEDGTYYPTLENGYVFKNGANDLPIDAPVFMHFEDEGLRKRLLKELPKIDASILALISQINAVPTKNDPYAITLYMNDGYEIRGDIPTLAEKINYYPSIIAQIENGEQPSKGIIDIEVGTFFQSYDKEYGTDAMNSDDENLEPAKEDLPIEGEPLNEDTTSQQLEEQPEQLDTSSEGA